MMERAMQGDPMETLLFVAKHPSTHVGLNPSIMITRTVIPAQLKGIKPEKLVESMLPILTHGFFDVRIEEWQPSVVVGGRKGASATTTYSIHSKTGAVIQARGRMVIVPDGDAFLMFGMSSPASGADDARGEFTKFLSTVTFKPKA